MTFLFCFVLFVKSLLSPFRTGEGKVKTGTPYPTWEGVPKASGVMAARTKTKGQALIEVVIFQQQVLVEFLDWASRQHS